ncbi:MAG: hypothetical protein ABW252_21445 [Polyangiales bacterium]
MKRAALALAASLLACASLRCGKDAPPTPPPRTSPVPTHFLGEWFPLGDARCRIERAERSLLEQRAGEGQVAEDVLLVDTRWSCVDAREHPVDVAGLLPRAGAIAWVDDQHGAHLRSPRRHAPNHMYFAVPTEHDGLRRPRRYHPDTAEPDGARELREARITLGDASGPPRVVVAPWRREHDAALDALLDRLVHTLAHGAPFEALSGSAESRDALTAAGALYRQALATFAPQRVAIREVDVVEGQPRAVLGFERSTIEAAQAGAFSLAFELDPGAQRVLRVLDPERARVQLGCVAERRALATRIDPKRDGGAAAAIDARTTGPRCNALGSLLPGRCDDVAPDLLKQALDVGLHCGDLGAVGLDTDEPVAVPADFEVHLRRGRSLASLDRSPRYQLSLHADGAVDFLGEHWVSQLGSGSGRSDRRLLGALYAQLLRSGWFERVEADSRRCHRDDRGDTLRVRADGKERIVRDREGCRAGFESRELAALRRAIERVGGVDAWVLPSARTSGDSDQIWVVAAE